MLDSLERGIRRHGHVFGPTDERIMRIVCTWPGR
jgi:hypothetical protein